MSSSVTFIRRKEIAPGIWEYFFLPERKIDFVPGQYVDLKFPKTENDPRGQSRVFTLTSLPKDDEMSFITKHFDVQSPYKNVLAALKPGDAGSINDAMGDLVLPKSKSTRLIFVAGGIGMASYASMLKELAHCGEQREVHLYYSLRNKTELVCRDLIENYKLKLFQIISHPKIVSALKIKKSFTGDALVYISGSQNFVEDLRVGLESHGIPRGRIVFDYFDGYAEL